VKIDFLRDHQISSFELICFDLNFELWHL